MNDLVDQFEALLETYQYAVWLGKHTDASEAIARNAKALADFLLEHGPTVTFDASAEPSAAAFESQYEWDDERRNWFPRSASDGEGGAT